jgi:hypothetical protein
LIRYKKKKKPKDTNLSFIGDREENSLTWDRDITSVDLAIAAFAKKLDIPSS